MSDCRGRKEEVGLLKIFEMLFKYCTQIKPILDFSHALFSTRKSIKTEFQA